MWIDELVLEQCHEPMTCITWVPKSPYLVLGNANAYETECNTEHCEADAIPVLRRSGGGGAVVLHSGCVILSVGLWVKHYYRNAEYFKSINDAVINCLRPEFHGLSQNGISDITLSDRKIAGTSLFRSRNYLLYQASILVESKLELIERYLAHPSKEPAYRNGKPHSEFLSSLSEFRKDCTTEGIKSLFEKYLHTHLQKELGEDLIEAQEAQIKYLKNRSTS